MTYALVLFFKCGLGCGYPAYIVMSPRYKTYEQCDVAGRQWLSPNANPRGALARYECSNSPKWHR
jgi:hypothetical protein